MEGPDVKTNLIKQTVSLLISMCVTFSLLCVPAGAYTPRSLEAEGRVWVLGETYGGDPSHDHHFTYENSDHRLIREDCSVGAVSLYICRTCGAEWVSGILAPIEHKYVLTGTGQGERIYTCSNCNASYREPIGGSGSGASGSSANSSSGTGTSNSGPSNSGSSGTGSSTSGAPGGNTGSNASGVPGGTTSGSTDMQKLSREEIIQLLNDNPLTLPDNVFVTEPSYTAPYAPGKVKQEALQAALDRLNALRRIAGLPSVSLDAGWCDEAQYGAILLSVSGFSHTPSRPSDMDSSFYSTAKSATSSSNISAGRTLTSAVDGFMDDSSASNIDRLGHRRWQLNPYAAKVGFGFAAHDGQYVTEKVVGDKEASCSFDFIAWPASGNFPSTLFSKDMAWSASINPDLYQTPQKSAVSVTLTRQSDGKSWTFSGNQNYTAAKSGTYFNVENTLYGYASCIIFRPGDVDAYEGTYSVAITGLKTKNGTAANISYQVDFFNPGANGSAPSTSSGSTGTTPSASGSGNTGTTPSTGTSQPTTSKTSSASSAQAATTVWSPQDLKVDDKYVNCEKYNIGGSNYFKLRDLAHFLNGTGSQFDVGFDEATSTVSVTTGAAYTSDTAGLEVGPDKSRTAQPSRQTIKIDGAARGDLTVYNIGGNNYFQLRELGDALGFDVNYDAHSNTAIVYSRRSATAAPERLDTGNFSDAYMRSKYYQNLQNVTLTGDYRTDIIAIAESQIGYHEGNNESQLDGSYSGNGDYSEYGRYLGSMGTAWCSEFASWCARMAEVPTGLLANSKGASIQTFAAPYHTWDETVFAGGNYLPQAGDLVLFAWTGKSLDDRNLSHTAIVHSVRQNGDTVTLTVVHGNSGNCVQKSDFVVNSSNGKVSNGQIGYFVAPNY